MSKEGKFGINQPIKDKIAKFPELFESFKELTIYSILSEKSLGIIIDILETRKEIPEPLSRIINIYDRFSELSEVKLTPENIELMNKAIKYFEEWFYSGAWTKVTNKQNENPNAYAYFSVPAVLINAMAKFKEKPEYLGQIQDFDKEKLKSLISEIDIYVSNYMSKDRLEALLRENLNEDKKRKIEYLSKNRESILRAYENAKSFYLTYLNGNKQIGAYNASDLYFLKTCLIAGEIRRREEKVQKDKYIFLPDNKVYDVKGSYEVFDFSQGSDKYSSMHYPKERLLFTQFVVEYLRNKK